MTRVEELERILDKDEELRRQQALEEQEAPKKRYQHKEKNGFVVYHDWIFYINQIKDDATVGRLFRALFSFNVDGEIVDLDDAAANMALAFMIRQFERDRVKYDKRCEKNKTNRAMQEEKKRRNEEERRASTTVDENDR